MNHWVLSICYSLAMLSRRLFSLSLLVISTASNDLQLDRRDDLATSPPVYPSPWMNPQAIGWEEAYQKAKDFVSQLTLTEKVNLTTGVGYVNFVTLVNHGRGLTCL